MKKYRITSIPSLDKFAPGGAPCPRGQYRDANGRCVGANWNNIQGADSYTGMYGGYDSSGTKNLQEVKANARKGKKFSDYVLRGGKSKADVARNVGKNAGQYFGMPGEALEPTNFTKAGLDKYYADINAAKKGFKKEEDAQKEYEKARKKLEKSKDQSAGTKFRQEYEEKGWDRFDSNVKEGSGPNAQYSAKEARQEWGDPEEWKKFTDLVHNAAVAAPLLGAAGAVGGSGAALLQNPTVQAGLTAYGLYDATTNTLPEAYRDLKQGNYWEAAGNAALGALDLAPGVGIGSKALKGVVNYGSDVVGASRNARKLILPKYKDVYRVEHAGFDKASNADDLTGRWFADNPQEVQFYASKLKDPKTGEIIELGQESPVRIMKDRIPEYKMKTQFGEGMPEEAKMMSMGRGNFTNTELDELLGPGAGERFTKGKFTDADLNSMETAPFLYRPEEGILNANRVNELRSGTNQGMLSRGKTNTFGNQSEAINFLSKEKNRINTQSNFKNYLPFKEGGSTNSLRRFVDGGEPDCPPNSHWDPEQGVCVKNLQESVIYDPDTKKQQLNLFDQLKAAKNAYQDFTKQNKNKKWRLTNADNASSDILNLKKSIQLYKDELKKEKEEITAEKSKLERLKAKLPNDKAIQDLNLKDLNTVKGKIKIEDALRNSNLDASTVAALYKGYGLSDVDPNVKRGYGPNAQYSAKATEAAAMKDVPQFVEMVGNAAGAIPLLGAAGALGGAGAAIFEHPLVQAGLTGYGVYDAATNTVPEAYKDFSEGRYWEGLGNTALAGLDLMPGAVFGDFKRAGNFLMKNTPLKNVSNLKKFTDSKNAMNVINDVPEESLKIIKPPRNPEKPLASVDEVTNRYNELLQSEDALTARAKIIDEFGIHSVDNMFNNVGPDASLGLPSIDERMTSMFDYLRSGKGTIRNEDLVHMTYDDLVNDIPNQANYSLDEVENLRGNETYRNLYDTYRNYQINNRPENINYLNTNYPDGFDLNSIQTPPSNIQTSSSIRDRLSNIANSILNTEPRRFLTIDEVRNNFSRPTTPDYMSQAPLKKGIKELLNESANTINTKLGEIIDRSKTKSLKKPIEITELDSEVNKALSEGLGIKKGDVGLKVKTDKRGNTSVLINPYKFFKDNKQFIENEYGEGSFDEWIKNFDKDTWVDSGYLGMSSTSGESIKPRKFTEILSGKKLEPTVEYSPYRGDININTPGLKRGSDFPFKNWDKDFSEKLLHNLGLSAEISQAYNKVLKDKGYAIYSGGTGHLAPGAKRYARELLNNRVEIANPKSTTKLLELLDDPNIVNDIKKSLSNKDEPLPYEVYQALQNAIFKYKKQGGIVADLRKDQIDDYIKRGYVVEQI